MGASHALPVGDASALTDLEREELYADVSRRKAKLLATLRSSQRICERNEAVQTTAAELRELLFEEMAARGVLLWARTNLTHEELSGAFTNKVLMPPLLALMVEIASR